MRFAGEAIARAAAGGCVFVPQSMLTSSGETARSVAQRYVGQVVAGYELLAEIGRGGMGTVFEALHEESKERAAVKILLSELLDSEESVERFKREAHAASAVVHKGLVRIHEHGFLPDGAPYILMEFLAGESLQARLDRLRRDRQRMAIDRAIAIVSQIAEALAAVHSHGIVHRDLKPGNVILQPGAEASASEVVKVVDFGLAQIELLGHGGSAIARQTTEGKFLGTAIYASPEQCRAEGKTDSPSDVYSLGVIFYELLAGRPPFVGGAGAVIGMHIYVQPPPLRELSALGYAELGQLVLKMLAKDPARRPSMQKVAERLRAVPLGSRRRRSYRMRVLLEGALLLGLGTFTFARFVVPRRSAPSRLAVVEERSVSRLPSAVQAGPESLTGLGLAQKPGSAPAPLSGLGAKKADSPIAVPALSHPPRKPPPAVLVPSRHRVNQPSERDGGT
jgi:serine/threonine-protein kinase